MKGQRGVVNAATTAGDAPTYQIILDTSNEESDED